MKTYARIANGVVMELITTAEPIGILFHPSLHWDDVTGTQVRVGWVLGADGTLAPPPAAPAVAAVTSTAATVAPAVPTVAQPAVAPTAATEAPEAAVAPVSASLNNLLAEIATLRAQVAQLHVT